MNETTRPLTVVASTARWRLPDGDSMTVLAITNGRSRIFIAPEDLNAIARALVTVLEAQEVRA
ncbi:hypothetical protein GCM10028787_10750 [Brachybacterium horti]